VPSLLALTGALGALPGEARGAVLVAGIEQLGLAGLRAAGPGLEAILGLVAEVQPAGLPQWCGTLLVAAAERL
jgi:hypothetical protein